MHTHDYAGHALLAAPAINRDNAKRLQAVCAFQLGDTMTFQNGPIVYDGTLYLTTDLATVALDAATCRSKWRHAWTPRAQTVWSRNRGVAIKDGRLFRGTPDGYLVSIDRAHRRSAVGAARRRLRGWARPSPCRRWWSTTSC